MDVRFPILSIVSLAALLFFGLQGDVELHSLEIGFSATPSEVRVTVDPAFAIWVPQSVVRSVGPYGCNAFTYGNVMVLGEQWRDNRYGTYLLAYEGNHIEQFYALGLFMWPAQCFINIESPRSVATDWNDPSQCDRTMWLPPPCWIDQWHFLSVSF